MSHCQPVEANGARTQFQATTFFRVCGGWIIVRVKQAGGGQTIVGHNPGESVVKPERVASLFSVRRLSLLLEIPALRRNERSEGSGISFVWGLTKVRSCGTL